MIYMQHKGQGVPCPNLSGKACLATDSDKFQPLPGGYMNPFKKIILTLAFALAFFSSDALAQCGGKTVYVQLPSTWNKTSIYIMWEGNIRTQAITATEQGIYSVFTIPTNLTNDNANNNNSGFYFSMNNANVNSGSNRWIGRSNYDVSGYQQDNDYRISCSAFGTSNVLYVYPNPLDLTKTLVTTEPPDAYYFYFLPPKETEWILNTPHLALLRDGDTTLVAMQPDPDRCGWFRLIYFNEDPPSTSAVIYSSGDRYPKDKVGILGLDEEYSDWIGGPGPGNGHPTPFNLMGRFTDLNAINNIPRNIFFAAQNGTAGWTTNDPGIEEEERCKYNLAAIIYMHAVGGSFSQYDGQDGACGNGTVTQRGYGQPTRGIVRNTLDENRRMVINSNMIGNSSGWCTADQFNNAFKFTEGYNIEVCYDMPFERVASGNWEFDSDRMTNPAGLQVGGFFPHVVYDPYLSADGRGMGQCAGCLAEHTISASPSIVDTGVAAVTWRGVTYRNIEAFDRTDAASFPQNAFSYNYGNRITGRSDDMVRPLNATWTNKGHNHICFESHSDFTYNGGEEFFFRGDDDIWVFINNKLVIDLGGNHEALPGYVDLDTIGGCTYKTTGGAELSGNCSRPDDKLVKGNKYNMDIFFCDRRGTNANVRISTNLYFEQKNGLYLEGSVGREATICIESSGGGSCAAVSGSSENSSRCGDQVANEVEYYIQNRSGTQNYPLNDQTCTRDNPSSPYLNCYGGIRIDTRDGKVQISTDNITGFTGTYIIYVRVKEEYAKIMSPEPSPLELGRFSIGGRTTVAFGNVIRNDQTGSHIRSFDIAETNVVASKLVPLGFAAGNWDNTSNPRTFTVDMDLSPGIKFNIANTSTSDINVSGSSLRIYECVDGDGNDRAEINDYETDCVERDKNYEFTVPSSGPTSGLKVLWFTGNYEADDNATYAINVTGASGPAFNLTVWPPKIEFLYANSALIPENDRIGSDPGKEGQDGSAESRAVYISNPLTRIIAAYDPTVTPNVLCTTCNFESVQIITRTVLSNRPTVTANEVIDFNGKSLVNGVGNLLFSGVIPVPDDANQNPDQWASFTVRGPSAKAGTEAKWDSLRFTEPPVPRPSFVKIFDRDGDGIGDSLIVVYNRKFPVVTGSDMLDSLPNYLQVTWSKDTTQVLGFGLAVSSGGRYTNYGITTATNWDYWKSLIKRAPATCPEGVTACGDTIAIALPFGGYTGFSEEIKTARFETGGERVSSWASFVDDGSETSLSFTGNIQDGIPPIVISASYSGDETNCGTAIKKCDDRITVTLSEPVVAIYDDVYRGESADDGTAGIEYAFAYKVRSRANNEWRIHKRGIDLPYENAGFNTTIENRILWGNKKPAFPSSTGDSTVRLDYRSYIDGADTTYTPVANDSIRLAYNGAINNYNGIASNFAALKDLAGNGPNVNEKGRRIEGKNRFITEINRIAEQDPNGDILGDALDLIGQIFPNIDKDKLFGEDSPAELLPARDDWDKDSIAYYYPGSVGPFFKPDVETAVNNILEDSKYKGKVTREDLISSITFYASAFYHTNLGNYVAQSNLKDVSCDDPIFREIGGANNCLDNHSKIYLAWNLKDNKNRWVGAGAYVEVYDFYWRIEYEGNGITIKETYDKQNKKVEMLGVKRVKKNK